MSWQVQSGELHSIEEVLPHGLRTGAEATNVLLQRKRVKVSPQGGQDIGSAGTGAGNKQLSFLLSGQGGFIDTKSAVFNRTVFTSGAAAALSVDDGVPISILNVNLSGQPLEQLTNVAKVCNMEMTLAGSQSYYKTAASFQGFHLLSPDCITTMPVTGIASQGQWGYVANNLADCKARQTRAATPQTGNQRGETHSTPLSLFSGFFRCSQYIPDMLGDLTVTMSTLAKEEYMFNATNTNDGDYSLTNISIEYDVVYPHPEYVAKVRSIINSTNDALVIPFESTIVSTGATIAASTALIENTLVASRGSANLTRVLVGFMNSAGQASVNWPSQSCWSHAGLWSILFRIGSSIFPTTGPAQGDASIFNMSLAAYGEPTNENGSVTNRALWCQSSDSTTAGTPKSWETSKGAYAVADTNDIKFVYGDRCVVGYSFKNAKSLDTNEALDGFNMLTASGSQLQVVVQHAPLAAYQPYIALVGLKMIKASGSSVLVLGG